jgi:RNase P protein component
MWRLFKSQRIRKASDFAAFRSPRAVSVYSGVLILKFIDREVGDACCYAEPRFGMIVSKKVGKAV